MNEEVQTESKQSVRKKFIVQMLATQNNSASGKNGESKKWRPLNSISMLEHCVNLFHINNIINIP